MVIETFLFLEALLTLSALFIFRFALRLGASWQRVSLFLLAAVVAVAAALLNSAGQLRTNQRLALLIVHIFFLSQALSWFVLKERLRTSVLIGGLLIAGGAVLICLHAPLP